MNLILKVSVLLILFSMIAGCCELLTPQDDGQPSYFPEAKFIADVTSGPAPFVVNFTDLSRSTRDSSFREHTIIEWNWAFGDGANSTEQNPTHTYTIKGNYSVTLTVKNDENFSDDHSIQIIVTSSVEKPPKEPPECSFTTNVISGIAPLLVQFTDTSIDPDGNIVEWNWVFFDGGQTSSEQNPTHTFMEEGVYQVLLVIVDNDGFVDDFQSTIKVIGDNMMTYNTTADTYVDKTKPDSNFGGYTTLVMKEDFEVYLKFTGLPAGSTIEKAEVKVYTTFPLSNGIEVEALTSSSYWSENTVTWNNGMTNAIGHQDSTEVNGTQQWFSWDVTSGVKADMASGSVTIILRPESSGHAQFFSKEGDSNYLPKLEITLSS